ncbi:MAG: diaminopimelate epimerase [Rhodospirillaceae bacterium]
MTISFLKMHGLGNDFVVIDARNKPLDLTVAKVRAIAERRTGIGCDQLIVIERPRTAGTAAFMRIRNADGSEVSACGNASRCVAAVLMEEAGTNNIEIETKAGRLLASRCRDGRISVDMGPARLDWREIPLSTPADTHCLDITAGPLSGPVAVSMGNPHAVFFVESVEKIPLAELGPELETHPLFPERTNVEIVQVLAPDRLRMRVWERGAGITSACGTGACAALVAAVRRNLTGRRAAVVLDGGVLDIEWQEDGHVLMTGPAATSFSGRLTPELLTAVACS